MAHVRSGRVTCYRAGCRDPTASLAVYCQHWAHCSHCVLVHRGRNEHRAGTSSPLHHAVYTDIGPDNCDMTVWQYDWVTIWLCDNMTVWQYDCMTTWLCCLMTVWQYDCVIIWLCDKILCCFMLWLCDNMTVWLWDNMTVLPYDCVTTWLCDDMTVWQDTVLPYDCVTIWSCDNMTV